MADLDVRLHLAVWRGDELERAGIGDGRIEERVDHEGRVDLLAAQPDVNASAISASAREVAGVWLLMAAALDPRIGSIWLDRTPHSLRASLDSPLSRNLHDALLPGFALKWDLADLTRAISPRPVIWSDPTDWMGTVVPNIDGCLYRTFEEGDDRFWEKLWNKL